MRNNFVSHTLYEVIRLVSIVMILERSIAEMADSLKQMLNFQEVPQARNETYEPEGESESFLFEERVEEDEDPLDAPAFTRVEKKAPKAAQQLKLV